MEAANLPQDAMNVVTYEGGGAARAAVAGGQVDITIVGGEGTEGIREMIRPLAVVRDDRAEGWDAPPVNEALAEVGMEIPVVNGSIRGLRSEEHTSELQSLMRNSYAVFCLKKKTPTNTRTHYTAAQ